MTSNELITQLLRLKESPEETYLKAKAMSEKEDLDCDSILNSLEVKNNARIDIIKLLSNEGPEIIRK